MPKSQESYDRERGPRMVGGVAPRECYGMVSDSERRVTALRGFETLSPEIGGALSRYGGTIAEMFVRNMEVVGYRHPEDRRILLTAAVDPDAVLEQEEALRTQGVPSRLISGAQLIAVNLALEDLARNQRR